MLQHVPGTGHGVHAIEGSLICLGSIVDFFISLILLTMDVVCVCVCDSCRLCRRWRRSRVGQSASRWIVHLVRWAAARRGSFTSTRLAATCTWRLVLCHSNTLHTHSKICSLRCSCADTFCSQASQARRATARTHITCIASTLRRSSFSTCRTRSIASISARIFTAKSTL